MDKIREEFESYWTARCNELGIECVLTKLIDDEYYNIAAHYAWLGWKAAKAQAVPEWIPVSERLPYDDELVLVYDSEGTHWRVYTLRAYKQFFDKFKCATHWMPLPKAPEQK